ncbi:(d)CMP kinase [Desulfospira joergensenii]|uniref:(d)CMP kinase n=1 Tax=Desulfospira joergensenii TaxID=53329 RepID=UPI0003B49333|nr:(d)CMP kinase [Desulfospira joergensenii]
MSPRIITIDGPAGAGKTTVSKALAADLGCVYVDTGALYRGVAYEIQNQNADWEKDEILAEFLTGLDLNFILDGPDLTLVSSGKDITPFIRTSEISMLASAVSARPEVRATLLDLQRRIGMNQDAVFEGRDMGTVVFPDADFKFFLSADISVRARRRFDETGDQGKDFQTVQAEMSRRDHDDTHRKEAPLKPAPDAVRIDSTHLSILEVVARMKSYIQNS